MPRGQPSGSPRMGPSTGLRMHPSTGLRMHPSTGLRMHPSTALRTRCAATDPARAERCDSRTLAEDGGWRHRGLKPAPWDRIRESGASGDGGGLTLPRLLCIAIASLLHRFAQEEEMTRFAAGTRLGLLAYGPFDGLRMHPSTALRMQPSTALRTRCGTTNRARAESCDSRHACRGRRLETSQVETCGIGANSVEWRERWRWWTEFASLAVHRYRVASLKKRR